MRQTKSQNRKAEKIWRKMITAAAKQHFPLVRHVDMSVYNADGPTSSDRKAKVCLGNTV